MRIFFIVLLAVFLNAQDLMAQLRSNLCGDFFVIEMVRQNRTYLVSYDSQMNVLGEMRYDQNFINYQVNPDHILIRYQKNSLAAVELRSYDSSFNPLGSRSFKGELLRHVGSENLILCYGSDKFYGKKYLMTFDRTFKELGKKEQKSKFLRDVTLMGDQVVMLSKMPKKKKYELLEVYDKNLVLKRKESYKKQYRLN